MCLKRCPDTPRLTVLIKVLHCVQGRQTREISQGVRLLILERLTASGPERLRAIKGPKAFNSALPCASYPFHKYSSFFAPPWHILAASEEL